MNNLTKSERDLLNYYLNNYNAKWMQVFSNKHPIFETNVVFYSIFKRKLKNQPLSGERTCNGMFRSLIEGKFYFIPKLLESSFIFFIKIYLLIIEAQATDRHWSSALVKKNISFANRGMDLETLINEANEFYLKEDIAVIYKKPTPIKVLKVNETKTRIKDGFYEQKSTLDYNGIYQGKYLEFDAKETNSKTSFPLSNIHTHQIEHIKNVLKYQGIAFLIIRFNYHNKTFILPGSNLINFINTNSRKSIPYEYFTNNCKVVSLKYNPRLDYLKLIDIL